MKGANYKIEKKMGFLYMRYYVYKRWFFGLLWKRIGWEMSVEAAERVIQMDKDTEIRKKTKPELVGWYK